MTKTVSDKGGRVFVDTNYCALPRRGPGWMAGVQLALMLLAGGLVTALSPGLAALGSLGACGP